MKAAEPRMSSCSSPDPPNTRPCYCCPPMGTAETHFLRTPVAGKHPALDKVESWFTGTPPPYSPLHSVECPGDRQTDRPVISLRSYFLVFVLKPKVLSTPLFKTIKSDYNHPRDMECWPLGDMPVIPAPKRHRQEGCEFKASLGNIRLSQKHTKKGRKEYNKQLVHLAL